MTPLLVRCQVPLELAVERARRRLGEPERVSDATPEIVKRYTAVMYETARWANRNHKASAPMLVKYTKMEPDDVDKMIRVDFAEQTRASEYQPLLDTCAKYGYLPKQVAAADLLLT